MGRVPTHLKRFTESVTIVESFMAHSSLWGSVVVVGRQVRAAWPETQDLPLGGVHGDRQRATGCAMVLQGTGFHLDSGWSEVNGANRNPACRAAFSL
jgi:hypothetical protein